MPLLEKNFSCKSINVRVLRLDRYCDPSASNISGNKRYKLKYHLQEAARQKAKTLISFGGAWSNHLYAFSWAASAYGFDSVAVVRGDEISNKTILMSETLQDIQANGTQLYFVDREKYRQKDDRKFLNELMNQHERAYLIPEGGGGEEGFKGCEEFARQELKALLSPGDVVVLAVGTGVTMAGIVAGLEGRNSVLGVPVLKGMADQVSKDIRQLLKNFGLADVCAGTWEIKDDYHFGGYGKVNMTLHNFLTRCNLHYQLPLDYVYTGKAFFALTSLIENNYFERGSNIVFLHTGGLQGNRGFAKRFKAVG